MNTKKRNKRPDFAQALRQWRTGSGMTQKQLSKKTGISEMHLSHFENGRRLPNLRNFKALCAGLGTTADNLLWYLQ